MTDAGKVVRIYLAAGRTSREWCDRCLTSARLVTDIYALADDGPRRIGTRSGCTNCDPHLFA